MLRSRAPVFALLSLLACASPGPGGAPAERPNFVFFVADDLGWADLGCYGSTFYETPNLDRLAADGARFTQAYATAPVCSPTRGSLLCGKYPARTGTTEWFGGRQGGAYRTAEYLDRLPLEEVTLAEALREAGYDTFFAGKWHLGGEGFGPEQQGFDENVGGISVGTPPGGYFSPHENPKLPDGPEGEHLTGRLTDECLRFLRSRGERPFLLYLSYYAVHTPLQARPDLLAHYEAKAAGLPPHPGPRFRPEGEREARQVQDHAVYAAMVHALDESVGRVLDELEALGLADETVVFFTSDNGGLSTAGGSPTSNLPLRAGKGWTYEGGIRVPTLARWPGAPRGVAIDEPIASVDFYPTALELAGLPPRPEQHVDGVSFAPLVRGEPFRRGPLYWHYPHYSHQGCPPSGAVRDGDLKLVEDFEARTFELYDLAADPGEQRDLAAERPGDVARLRGRLLAWRAEMGARMIRAKDGS